MAVPLRTTTAGSADGLPPEVGDAEGVGELPGVVVVAALPDGTVVDGVDVGDGAGEVHAASGTRHTATSAATRVFTVPPAARSGRPGRLNGSR